MQTEIEDCWVDVAPLFSVYMGTVEGEGNPSDLTLGTSTAPSVLSPSGGPETLLFACFRSSSANQYP